jgi:solute carrier family 25 (mitochondrial carnitine/acylcarnitine transporter), member 20/29|tara:strand:- start:2 stop:649 length:648 start_codon:yes stop_codon:yes gene_type:complete
MNDFFAGGANGIVQTLIGHPIDTIKILQQTNHPLHRNIIHYYKGISYPMTFNLFCSGMTFSIHNNYNHYLNLNCHYMSGFLSGLTMAPIIYYVDVGKIHYQINPKKPFSFLKFKATNGMIATLGRESLATSLYMGVYFNYSQIYGPLLSGGVAGLLSWTISYPLDVIKTRQMNNVNLNFFQAMNMGYLWRGYTICAIRAILVNACGFWAYDNIRH